MTAKMSAKAQTKPASSSKRAGPKPAERERESSSSSSSKRAKQPEVFQTELVAIAALKPHPKNYRQHPEDQILHLAESIRQNGFYRNIVVSKDNVILAGHGVVLAAQHMGLVDVPVIRLHFAASHVSALKVIAADNEVSHLGERDDRALSELLKEIKEFDESALLGTGYDEKMLANLIYVTRPESEIATLDEAAQWVGMPEYEDGDNGIRVNVHFDTIEDRAKFLTLIGADPDAKASKSIWWPLRGQRNRQNHKFMREGKGATNEA